MSFSSSYSVPYANNNSDSRYPTLPFPSFMLYGLVGGYEEIESAGQQATRQRMLKFNLYVQPFTIYFNMVALLFRRIRFPRRIICACGHRQTLLRRHVLRSLAGNFEGRGYETRAHHQRDFKQEGQA